jgi:hypothetical protein
VKAAGGEFADPMSGKSLQIFKFIWLPEANPLHPEQSGGKDLREARLGASLNRMPRTDARMLIAVVSGEDDPQESWHLFQGVMTAALSLPEPEFTD